MRISTAALALIERRRPDGAAEYLVQWSESWHMFALVGGHVEPGESFRGCCVREVAEELELTPDVDFRVAADPLRPVFEYTAMSQSAGVETLYRVELYAVDLLTPAAEAKVNANTVNRWVAADDIRRCIAADGQEISTQVMTVLTACGIIFPEKARPSR